MKQFSLLSRATSWMISNPIASNLLMIAIIVSGFVAFDQIRQESSPSFNINEIEIEVDYPGATPSDVEQGIVLAIEQKLRDNADIDRLSAHISQGRARVTLSLNDGVVADSVLAEVKNSLDSISSFPADMEAPTVTLVKEYDSLVEFSISGNTSELALYQQANTLKQKLLNQDGVSQVQIRGARQPEVVIELNQQQLRQYSLTIEQVLNNVRQSSLDVPAGQISTSGGDVLIRTLGRKELSSQYHDIVIINDPSGSNVTLSQIATITQDFNGQKKPFLVDGKPGLMLMVFQTKDAKPIALSAQLIDYIDQLKVELDDGIELTLLEDASEDYSARLSLLTENGLVGMFLVILALTFFLDFRLAFWVSMGIPIAIIGTLGLMPILDLPINMVTLFAFIITLGILVDDAVIVAENIYQKISEGVEINQALKEGAGEMAMPVLFSVATNIIAFIPLLFVPGELGVMYKPMTLLIFATFIVSLVEALFILPHHLRNLGKPSRFTSIVRIQQRSFKWFEKVKNKQYKSMLTASINNPSLTIVVFVVFCSLVVSWVSSGRVESSFVPKIESTRIDAEVEFPAGSTLAAKEAVLANVERAGHNAMNQVGSRAGYKYTMSYVGSLSGSVTFMIVSDDQRAFSALEFVDAWRAEIGAIAGVKSLFFDYQVGPGGGKEIVVELGHEDSDKLADAAHHLMDQMRRVNGITDIDSALVDGQLQYDLVPNPLGSQLGFTSASLGQQLRYRFYGGEALRQIVDGDEIKVRVLMSKAQHSYANQLAHLIIKAPNGEEVELGQVAVITPNVASSSIERVDGIELVEVTASILRRQVKSTQVFGILNDTVLSELQTQFPKLSIELGGGARIESKVNTEIVNGALLALAIIFAMLAITFRSYLDSIIVLLVIPFSLCAAMLGHVVLGYAFSVMSLFGMIALAGLVINGAFVMRLTMTKLISSGMNIQQAIAQAALSRFRPVVLTAVTTAAGLVPMLFETSTQALYLIPMVISLSFGTVFSMVIILLLTPAMFSLKYRLVR